MATKKDEAAQDDAAAIEPSPVLEVEVAADTPADEIEFVPGVGWRPAAPETYRELRPWTADTLVSQLNAAAANGWKLAAVVGSRVILERAR